MGYVDTHSPHKDAPKELTALYQKATFRDIADEKFADCHGTPRAKRPAAPAVERDHRSQYYGAVSSIDREVGKIINALEASGEIENTLIVYTSDHGFNCGQHGIWEKGNGTQPQTFWRNPLAFPAR